MEWHSFSAMGTTVSVLSDAIVIDPARMLFESIEAKLSRFRPTSELSRVNCDPSAVIEVSEILADVLAAADDARCRTDGLVDPAVGRAVRDWGYDRTFFEVADLSMAPDAASGGISWAITGTTLERDPGVVLDLGGIAKGWTADLALAETDALAVNAGGDLCSRHPDLRVHVCDPWGGRAATVAVGIGGLATSSTVRRTWLVA
ncbi:MAG: FAD:protein FMN transferase, partial [Acidimicrobiia bacterium]|nr:FAD:protein FMN transferase [Acidimicrobiia bacterium]